MSTLFALLLSTAILSGLDSAALNLLRPSPDVLLESAQGVDPQACIGVWLELNNALVTEGYARHGGIAWQGSTPVMIEPAITVEACPALLAAGKVPGVSEHRFFSPAAHLCGIALTRFLV